MCAAPARPTTDAAAAVRGTWVSRVTMAGVVAPPGFFAVMMVLGFVTPGYDWVSRPGSELSLGPLGWIMISNFVGLGLVEIALAAAAWRTIGDRASGRLASGALGLIGAALVVGGICVTDPTTAVRGALSWHGIVHALMAVVVYFVGLPIAGVTAALRFRTRPLFALYCAVNVVATPALLVLTFASGDLIGLPDRLVTAVALAWLTALAVQLHRAA